jgi:hypothetical protein
MQHHIVLYLDYLFSKNDGLFENELSPRYLLDHDISNINRFFINYLKNNKDFYIELESHIKHISNNQELSNLYYKNDMYNETVSNIKNVYIFQSLIQIYNLYYVYLNYDEKYNFLKQLFINLKFIISYPITIIYKLVSQILNSLNTIFDDIFIEIYQRDSPGYMTLERIVGYKNMINHTLNLYNSNETKIKTKYKLLDYYLYIFLFEHILNLFENNKKIDKSNIDIIIQMYKYKIDSPYFKYNLEDKTKMDLIINNKTITSKFDEISGLYNFLLSNILFNNNKNKCYINAEKTYIVFVLKKQNYNYTYSIIEHDIIIVFDIKEVDPSNIILLKNIYINSNKAILCTDDDILIYPFMAHASPCSLNIIEENNNDFIVHCIVNSYNSDDLLGLAKDTFHDIIIDKHENYYTSFNIKPNFLTPYITLPKITYLDDFYDIFPPYKKYVKYHKMYDKIELEMIDYAKIIKLNNLPITHIEEIRKILYRTGDDLVDIINSILSRKPNSKYIDLVQWINNNTSENTLTRYNGNFDCHLECSFIIKPQFRERIEQNLSLIKDILNKLTTSLNHNHSTFLEFLYNNYTSCNYIMIINIYISKLNRLLKVSDKDNCDKILCHELLEMNHIFQKRFDNVSKISGIVEIIFGNLLKNEQWEKIYSMYDNYNNRGIQKWEVHQFMMGKGKSSIITPMLIIMIAYHIISQDMYPKIYLVVPEHLKQQTIDTFIEYQFFFNIYVEVFNDTDMKILFLNKNAKRESFKDSIIFIDEFDYMYNPIQSNFNKIENAEQIDLELIDGVFNIVHRIIYHNKPFNNPKPNKVIYEITNILKDSNNIKNVSYGMSIKDNYRYCIPYLRKDSPNEGSKFSSILLTIVLTILYFYNKEKNIYILEEKDIKYAFSDKKIFNKLRRQYNIEDEDLETFLYKFNLINKKIGIPENIMIQYLKLIFFNFKKSEIVQNCSFIDIINMDSFWQVGYSGTVNIDMNIKPLNDITKYNIQVVIDNDEKENVQSALIYYPDVLQINNVDEMFNTFVKNNYNVLIDECAFLKDYDNKKVAEILFTKILDKYKVKKTIIYLLSNDTKMIYNGEHYIYQGKMYNKDEVVYYYSQRHIVGIDFKQPTILTGLVLLNSNSIYTNVSQAIFRMRKLNKGHSIRIGYVKILNGPSKTSSSEIYALLNINEQALNQQNKLLLIYQYLKFYVRKYYTKHYYEVDLDMFKEEPSKKTIYDKLAHNVFSIKLKDSYDDWIKYHTNNTNYKTFPKVPNDTTIKALLNMLLGGHTLNDLLKLVFNINSMQKEVSNEEQSINESQTIMQKQSEISTISLMPNKLRKIVIKYNPYYKYDTDQLDFFKKLNFIDLKFDNGYTLLFSFNLFHNITNCDSAIIIELSDTVYLLDSISMINHYVYMYRIYNLNGRCINNFIFEEKSIDFSQIFNYRLDDRYNQLDIGYILFNIDIDETPPKIQHTSINIIDKLFLLISISNINIFKRNDSYINNIKDISDMTNIDRLYKISSGLVGIICLYTDDFYKKVSNNYNTSSNELISIKKSAEIKVEAQHTLEFSFDNTTESIFNTFAT